MSKRDPSKPVTPIFGPNTWHGEATDKVKRVTERQLLDACFIDFYPAGNRMVIPVRRLITDAYDWLDERDALRAQVAELQAQLATVAPPPDSLEDRVARLELSAHQHTGV